MKININGKSFSLKGRDLYSYFCECIADDNQLKYNFILKKLKFSEIYECIEFIMKQDCLLTNKLKTIAVVCLIAKLKFPEKINIT